MSEGDKVVVPAVAGEIVQAGDAVTITVGKAGNPFFARLNRPRITCLCGSTRFYAEFQRQNYLHTMRGYVVLSVGFFRPSRESQQEELRWHDKASGETWGYTPEQKVALDELHKRKIDLADEIFVINVGGYVGNSTRSEIEYARGLGKCITYLEAPADFYDPEDRS